MSARNSTESDAEKSARRALREAEAINSGEHVSKKEATTRKFIAVGLSAITAVTYAVKGASFASPAVWSIPLTMAFATGLTGQKSVWGCSLAGKIKVSGRAEAPTVFSAKYAEYIWKKQKDFLFSMYGGVALSVVVTTAVLQFHGGIDVLNIASISQMALYSGLLNKKNFFSPSFFSLSSLLRTLSKEKKINWR